MIQLSGERINISCHQYIKELADYHHIVVLYLCYNSIHKIDVLSMM
jgi:hypothetical protein